VSGIGVFQWGRAVNEKHGIIDIVFLMEIAEERVSESAVFRRFKRCMKQFLRVGIDRSVQPVLLVVQSDHDFVDRNAVRASAIIGL